MRPLLLCLLLVSVLCAERWVLIGHPGLPAEGLDRETVRAIYLGRKRFLGDVPLVPLQLRADEPIRRMFEREIIGLSRKQLRQWWMRQHYLGRRPPKVMGSPAAVTAFVEQVEGAVGYLPFDALDGAADVIVLYEGDGELR